MWNFRQVSFAIAGVVAIGAARVGAQAVCGGSGTALGITAYQCGDCSSERRPGELTIWHFRTEPVVLKAIDDMPLRSGDVIEAIDGLAISTPDGAARFASTRAGVHHVTIRRDGRQLVVDVNTADVCPKVRATAHRGSAAASADGGARVADGATRLKAGTARGSRFGFAISCSSCTRRMVDGVSYWTFTSAPTIEEVEANGPAARAGVRAGDEIAAVDDQPIVARQESPAFGGITNASRIRLTLRRADGTRATVDIAARATAPGEPRQ